MLKRIHFSFLSLIIFSASCNSNIVNKDCSRFKTGNFILKGFDNSFSKIERSDSIQTETNSKTGTITKSRIVWLSECEYELKYLTVTPNAPDSIYDYIKEHSLLTRILKTGEDYYLFESEMVGVKQKLSDTIWLDK